MAAKTQEKKLNSDHVVIALSKRGLTTYCSVFGPFSKAQAYTYAAHRQQFEGDDCSVEQMESPCEHNKWIFEGVN
jgi:hypothetical protein